MRAAALALIGAATASCTWNTSQPLYAGSNPAPLNLTITTIPAPDANGQVTRSAVFILTCDDYPDPDSALFGPIQLRSGAATFDIDLRVSLVDKAIVVTPRSLLAPNTQYNVVVQPGVRALSSRTLATTVTQTVTVGVDQGMRPAPPPAYTWMGDIAADIATCAPSCHSPTGASGRTRTPTRLLDLTGDPTDPMLGLINAPAQGELGWPQPLLRVSPGDSAHSALLRKLLGGNPLADSRDASIPAMAVDGRRMPIQLDDTMPTPPPLDPATIRRVQNWIDEGALIN
jgi:hypothetical protein